METIVTFKPRTSNRPGEVLKNDYQVSRLKWQVYDELRSQKGFSNNVVWNGGY